MSNHEIITKVTAVIILLCALTACSPNENNPDVGSITFANTSNRNIIVLTAFAEDIEAALGSNGVSLRTLRPGGSFSRSFDFSADADDGEFCASKRWTTWILATDVEESRYAGDYDILDQLGPHMCWGQRDADYEYGDS